LFLHKRFLTLCLILSLLDGKTEQHVYIKFCVKFGRSATKTLRNVSWGFWKIFFKPYSGFWMSFTSQGRLCHLKRTNIQGNEAPAKWQKTIAEQSMSSQTPLGSVTEFAGNLDRKFERVPHCRGGCSPTLDKWSNVCLVLWEKANEGPTSVCGIIVGDEVKMELKGCF
jgi:hypothetical protein